MSSSRFLQPQLGTPQESGVPPIAIPYTLNEEFMTDEASPIVSPRDAEPGPGTITVATDSGNNLSIGGSALTHTVVPANGDPRWYSNALTGRVGRAWGFDIYRADGVICQIGADDVSSDDTPDRQLVLMSNTPSITDGGNVWASGINQLMVFPGNARHVVVHCLNSAGGYWFGKRIDIADDWKLFARTLFDTATTAYISNRPQTNGAQTVNIGRVRHTESMPAPFDADWGYASHASLGDHTSSNVYQYIGYDDVLMSWKVTALPSTSWQQTTLRGIDGTNRYMLQISSTGQCYLTRTIDGAQVTLKTTSTGAVSNGDIVTVVMKTFGNMFVYVNNTYLYGVTGETLWLGADWVRGLGWMPSGTVSDIRYARLFPDAEASAVLDAFIL